MRLACFSSLTAVAAVRKRMGEIQKKTLKELRQKATTKNGQMPMQTVFCFGLWSVSEHVLEVRLWTVVTEDLCYEIRTMSPRLSAFLHLLFLFFLMPNGGTFLRQFNKCI